jgi:hypothetical protein
MILPPSLHPARVELGGGVRQHLGVQPEALWLGSLTLFRVEAPVWVAPPDPFVAMRLALGDWQSAHPQARWEDAAERLHLPSGLTARLWDEVRDGPKSTARTLAHRVFHFLPDAGGGVRYVPLLADVGQPYAAALEYSFPLDALRDCCRRDPAWKARWHFPQDVVPVDPMEADVPDWRRITMVRVELLTLLLAAPAWQAWTIDPRTGTVRHPEPVLKLGSEARAVELFGPEVRPCSSDAWRTAWTQWARAHGLATPEANACTLRYEHGVLHVASNMTPERWRSFHHGREEWLQAGTGAWRCLALLALPRGA